MRKLEPLKYLAGSLVIYYVMAACSSAGGGPGSRAAGASSGGDASSGGGTSSGAGSSSGVVASSGGGSSSSGGIVSPVPDANADETQSGSRLKANYYVGGDGSKQFAGYFTDTGRNNEACGFQTAGDSATRCLPLFTGRSPPGYIGAYFSDSACSVSLAVATPGCSPAYGYLGSTTPGSCSGETQNTQYHIYPISGAYSGTIYSGSSTIADGGAGACKALTPAQVPTGELVFAVGAEVSPSSFQQATVQTM